MKTVCFDTETTGLIQNSGQPLDKQPHIIEFSAVLIEDDGKVLEELDFICNPGVHLDEIITKITGLKDSDLAGKAPFKAHWQAVAALLLKADAVVAHNLSYDYSLVNLEASRLNLVTAWPAIRICTVEATEHLKGYRLSLTALHELLFNEPFTGAHRAMQDVKALARCYVELLKRGVI